MQKLKISNKKNYMNSIQIENSDKNQNVLFEQDKSDSIVKNRKINLQQDNKSVQQLSQEKSNYIHQIKQEKNKSQFQIEDSKILQIPNISKKEDEKFNQYQQMKKIDCIHNIFKCLTLRSKTLKEFFSCYKNKIAKMLPKQNLTIIQTMLNQANRDQQQVITVDDKQHFIEYQESLQQPKYVNQQPCQNKNIQYDDTQENCNKITSEILEYKFAEFEQEDQQNQINQIDDEYFEHDILDKIKIKYRKWSVDIFNQQNQNLRENFVQNLDMIFGVLGKFNYFLCKQFFSKENMDLFIGYFQNDKGQKCDYIFKIYYYPNTSDIQDEIGFIKKYDQIKDDQVIQNYHIQITEQIQILIISIKTFLKLQSKSKKFQLLSFRYWNKKFFNDINDDKPFQPIKLQNHRNQCKNCTEKDCNQILNLGKFQSKQDKVLDKLQQNGIFLCEYVNKGGQGLIFEGYRRNIKHDYDDFIIKILFDIDKEKIEKEIKIMKLFEMNINVIKYIDFFQIEEKIYVFILEKCKYSLADELLIFKKDKQFTKIQLFKIIFDLLDGLIQLRIYNILHLDIKPANILLSSQGNYVYTDFGMSSIKKDGQQTIIEGGTPFYESPEQKQQDPDINFKSDVFSLGKTFQRVIQYYEEISQDVSIQPFINDIINKKMTQFKQISRDECLNLHESFLQTLIETNNQKEILDSYINKIQTILKLSSFDQNKDIPYILNLKLYYNLKLLYLFGIKIRHQNLAKIDTPFSINDFKAPQITIQKTNNLDILQLNDLQFIVQLIDNISECYHITGKLQQSLQYLNISLQMNKQIFKENHPNIATSLYKVGSCYRNLGENELALEYQLESLQMKKQIFKENHPDIATSLNSVGLCYQNLGDNKKALEYQLESLQMIKQIFKQNHPLIAAFLNNVGSCYQNLGDNKKALEYLLESLQMTKQIIKENHPLIAAFLNNVGSCYQNLGDNKMALEYLLESLQMIKQISNENHPQIAKSLNNVGLCYIHLDDNKKALEYLLESVQMIKQIFKENHPDIAITLNNVGQCYKNLGDNKKALEYLLESLQMTKQISKENHPDIVIFLNNVGLCYIHLGDKQMALEYQLESLQMTKQIFKKNHTDIATSLNNVGSCYQNLGDIGEHLNIYI